jgi:hypothetical protein
VDGRNIEWRTKMVSRFYSVDHSTMTMMTTIAVAMVAISLRFA